MSTIDGRQHLPDSEGRLRTTLESVWDEFIQGVSAVAEDLEARAYRGDEVQAMLRSVFDVAYYKAKELYTSEQATRSDPGPIGGLFFERFVAAAVRGYLRQHLPDASVSAGRGGPTYPWGAGLPPNPDLCAEYRGRMAVVEMKTSPKKPDLIEVEALKVKYASTGISFFFVGGEISASEVQLARFARLEWVSILAYRSKRFQARNPELIEKCTVDALLPRLLDSLTR